MKTIKNFLLVLVSLVGVSFFVPHVQAMQVEAEAREAAAKKIQAVIRKHRAETRLRAAARVAQEEAVIVERGTVEEVARVQDMILNGAKSVQQLLMIVHNHMTNGASKAMYHLEKGLNVFFRWRGKLFHGVKAELVDKISVGNLVLINDNTREIIQPLSRQIHQAIIHAIYAAHRQFGEAWNNLNLTERVQAVINNLNAGVYDEVIRNGIKIGTAVFTGAAVVAAIVILHELPATF